MQLINVHSIFSKFPVLALGKVNLRQLTKDDTKDFYSYISQDGVKKYLSDQETPRDLISAEVELMYWAGLFRQMRSIYWGIVTKDTNRLIGTCGYNNWSRIHNRVELSYDLNCNYWGRGIMTEAVSAITRFAFEELQASRIQATVVFDNISSMRVLEKAGYLCEGKLRNYNVLHNKTVDALMYAIAK